MSAAGQAKQQKNLARFASLYFPAACGTQDRMSIFGRQEF
jgi:hypothetical protein